MQTNTMTWGALLLLTIAGFSMRHTPHASDTALLILAAAGAKCSLLGWHFMELRRAHWIWRTAGLGLVGAGIIILGLVIA